MRLALLVVLTVFTLGACAGGGAGTRYSHVPKTQVVVKGGKKKPAQANYRVSPEESRSTGSGGSER
jgi:hypothetical protein